MRPLRFEISRRVPPVLRVDFMADRAYVVIPANYKCKQNGKLIQETGSMLAIAVQKARPVGA